MKKPIYIFVMSILLGLSLLLQVPSALASSSESEIGINFDQEAPVKQPSSSVPNKPSQNRLPVGGVSLPQTGESLRFSFSYLGIVVLGSGVVMLKRKEWRM